MTSCYFCTKLEYIPFKCRRCGHSFCVDHRLPESHNCESVRKTFQPTPPPPKQPPTPVIVPQPPQPTISPPSIIKLITTVYNVTKISIQSISIKLSIILTKRILFYKIKIAMRSDKIEYIKIDYIAANLSAYIRHCYLNNLINDKFIDESQKNFDKLTRLIALTESDNIHESNAAKNKAFKLCKQIFNNINKELNK